MDGGQSATLVTLNKTTGEEIRCNLSTQDSRYCHPIIIKFAGIR